VRAYQHLVEFGLHIGSVNRTVTALRFFHRVTMGRRDVPDMIALTRRPEKLRFVRTPEEVARLIGAKIPRPRSPSPMARACAPPK
jgi:hypothetical protein